MRKAVGDDFDIAVDAHGRLTTPMAVDFCRRVEELGPLFVEEVTQLEDLGELALLREKTRVPLATGERHFTKYAFADFCSRHLVDYVQPDVCHAGGILEMKKIGILAETYRIQMAPHNPQSTSARWPPCTSTPPPPARPSRNTRAAAPRWIQELFDGLGPTIKAGYAELPVPPRPRRHPQREDRRRAPLQARHPRRVPLRRRLGGDQ